MPKKNFTDLIDEMLHENKSATLRILLEEEEDDIFGAVESSDEKSEEEGEEESGGEEESSGEAESTGDEPESGGDKNASSNANTDSITQAQFEKLENNISKISKTYEKAYGKSTSFYTKIIDYINNFVSDIDIGNPISLQARYDLGSNNSIDYFLNEKVNPDRVIKDIEAIQNLLDKGDDLVNQFATKKDVDIEKYVQGAINAYDHFDSMFSKEQIILNAVEGHFMMTCGDSAPEIFEEFKEGFMASLNEKHGIEDDSTIIKHNDYHNASGASSVGKA